MARAKSARGAGRFYAIFHLHKMRGATIDATVYDSQFGISYRMNKLQPSRVP